MKSKPHILVLLSLSLIAPFPFALKAAQTLTSPDSASADARGAAREAVREPSRETLIAHRGESSDAPENTLPAYRMAVDRGFGFECDVYLSADGRVFTFHDGNLKRTSDGALDKRCAEASWEEEVSSLNVGGWGPWKGSKFDPTRPALLEEVCELARDGRWVYCEVKGDDVRVVSAIRKVLEGQRTATPSNFLFIAFSERICAALKRQLPSFRVYWLTSGRNLTAESVCETLKRIGADGVDICYDSSRDDEAYIRRVHDAGYSFHVWTIDDPQKAAEALARGADTVTTNRAKYILDETARRGQRTRPTTPDGAASFSRRRRTSSGAATASCAMPAIRAGTSPRSRRRTAKTCSCPSLCKLGREAP